MSNHFKNCIPIQNMAEQKQPLILITGCSGLIGTRLTAAFGHDYRIIGLDQRPPADSSQMTAFIECDFTAEQEIADGLRQVHDQFSPNVASVIHLATYSDWTGAPSPLYEDLNIEGTRILLRELSNQGLNVDQFVFASTLEVMAPSEDGKPIDAKSATRTEWHYPRSMLAAEQIILEERGDISAVILRIAGVYDDQCRCLPISRQISRIFEKRIESYLFPGDESHGQPYIHLDDLTELCERVVASRDSLSSDQVFLVGEEDLMSYAELQDELGQLIHAAQWPTIRIPKAAAKAGATLKDTLEVDDAARSVKPWMIDLADQHYPIDISHVRQALQWEPRHSLRQTLPTIVSGLRRDPADWYTANDLPWPEEIQEEFEDPIEQAASSEPGEAAE